MAKKRIPIKTESDATNNNLPVPKNVICIKLICIGYKRIFRGVWSHMLAWIFIQFIDYFNRMRQKNNSTFPFLPCTRSVVNRF